MDRKTLEKIWYQVPADYYDKGIQTNPFQFIWHNWKWLTMKKILQEINPTPSKILDVGSSAGHITAKITTLFPKADVFGLDSYDKAIKLGEKIYPEVKFEVGDAHKLAFKSGIFDLITCIETLEHLENPAKALAEMKRVLEPGGKILIGQDTNSRIFRLVWFFWTRSRGKVWQDSHIHSMDLASLEKLIKQTGFKIKTKKLSHLGLEVFFLGTQS